MKKENVFLSDDFRIINWDYDDIERYEYSFNTCAFAEYIGSNASELNREEKYIYKKTKDISIFGIEWLKDNFSEIWQKWEDNANQEELHNIPMMNALRYYPSFCIFDLQEVESLCSGSTTMIYDSKLDSYAIAMTGGGMDLAPHLLDTFIKIGSGVPFQIANNISLNYSAYVDEKQHIKNCKLLAKAYSEQARRFYQKAKSLTNK